MQWTTSPRFARLAAAEAQIVSQHAMNNAEAKAILAEQLLAWRKRSYINLAAQVGKTTCLEIVGPSGARYQIEIESVWDDRPGGNVRVIGSVDDGGIRAVLPLSDDFIVAPDGHFVGEWGGQRKP